MKDLQVWWIPQVPMKAFTVNVGSLDEGVKIMDVLADYDKFQFENNIKPDYCNAGGITVLEIIDEDIGPERVDWYDEETGEDDPHAYLEQLTRSE